MADTYTTEAIACGLSDVERGDAEGRPLERVRHLKRGTEYEVLGEADGLQIDEYGEPQAHKLVIYRRSDGPLRWMLPAYFNDGRFETIAPASPPASVTVTEGEKPRDRIASVRLLPWEPDSQGGALVTFDSGFKVAVPLYPLEGSARVTVTPAAPSHPGEADRVGLGELERLKHLAQSRYELLRECQAELRANDAWGMVETIEAALSRAGHPAPASLPALGTGEGSGGAGWMPIETAPKDETDVLIYVPESSEQFVAFYRDCAWQYAYYSPESVRIVSDGATHWQPLPLPPAPCDGSGEAGETHSGSTEGDSAVTEGQAPSPLPHPQTPNTLSEVEEATALLFAIDGVLEAAQQEADRLRDETDGYSFPNWLAQENHEKADRIEAALATLRASQEQAGEVRDV